VKKSLWLGVAFAVLFAVGCGSPADNLMKDTINLMNQMADAIEKKDEAKIKDLQKKIEENGKKLEELKLSADEKKKLEEKYKDDLTKAAAKVLAAGMKAAGGGMP